MPRKTTRAVRDKPPLLPLGGGLWDVVGANPADAAGGLKVAATVPTADSESNLHASF
jgi:hypothetical protein